LPHIKLSKSGWTFANGQGPQPEDAQAAVAPPARAAGAPPAFDLAYELWLLREEVCRGHALSESIKEEVAALRKSNRELSMVVEDLTGAVNRLSGHDGLIPTLSKVESDEDMSSDDEAGVLSPPVQIPAFDYNAKKFYVVMKGCCPGIYSSLTWARVLIDKLDHEDRHWISRGTLKEARATYKEAQKARGIAITGRHVGDERKYGPLTPSIPPFCEGRE